MQILHQAGQMGKYLINKGPAGDPLFSMVGLLLNFDQANGSTSPLDTSSYAHTVTAVGTNPPIIDNPGGLYGGAIRSRGAFLSNSYNSVPFNSVFSLGGTGEWCVEGWFYQTATTVSTQGIVSIYNTAGSPVATAQQFYVQSSAQKINARILRSDGVAVSLANPSTHTLNAWHHFALIRKGNIVYLLVDGVQVASDSTSFSAGQAVAAGGSEPLIVNRAVPSGGESHFQGKIDSLRITKGHYRYDVTGFTPPTEGFKEF